MIGVIHISLIIRSDLNHGPITLVILLHFRVDQAPSRSANALNFKCVPIRVNNSTLFVLFSLFGGRKKKITSGDAASVSLKEQRWPSINGFKQSRGKGLSKY